MHCAPNQFVCYIASAICCCAGAVSPCGAAAESALAITPKLRAQRQLSEFYTKAVDVEGILILGSDKAAAEALVEAKYLISSILADNPELQQALAAAGLRVTVMAPVEFTTDVPEHSELKPKEYWDKRARGLGGTVEIPVASCGEENLLEYTGDPYKGENILIHEFSHSVHLMGMTKLDPTFDERLQRTYEDAKEHGLWEGTYAATDHKEYFAEGSQSWFGCNAPPGGVHGEIRTREALREYDPALARMLIEAYGENIWQYTLPSERSDRAGPADLSGTTLRSFAWPERMKNVDITSPKY